MKFKIGDKVRLLKEKMNDLHCDETIKKFKNNEIGIISEIIHCYSSANFRIIFADGYNGCLCSEDEIELVCTKPSKRELLKMPLGTIIKTDIEGRNNVFVKVGEDIFCNDEDDLIEEDDIFKDLSLKFYGNEIVEIQEPTFTTIYTKNKEVREMTISEIEKELGYPIKVIKEN